MGLRDTDADWVKLAEENPFWAVLSREEFRGADLPKEKVRAFFDTGKKQIAATFGFVKKYLQPEFQPARCLDFGCGVGRLLIPMARMCEEAVGVDVAPEMLRLCEQFCAEECITNVRLVNSDDQLTGITEDFDFVNTLIVLQHIPPERGYSLIARLIALLKIGGVGALQLTYAKSRRLDRKSVV